MQWARVKNILIVILLVVDSFLAINLISRYVDTRAAQNRLRGDIATILADYGMICGEDFVVPISCSAVTLQTDRSRTAEEGFAKALLGAQVQHSEDEDGTASYTTDAGQVIWHSNGAVQAWMNYPQPPQGKRAVRRAAKLLLESAGVSMRGSSWETDEQSATMTSTVAGLPVFGRKLCVRFTDDRVTVTGCWTFETPYAAASDRARTYDAGDALISFVRQNTGITRIEEMEFGYHMLQGASGRLQLAPSWRIRTATGDLLFDAAKKTA